MLEIQAIQNTEIRINIRPKGVEGWTEILETSKLQSLPGGNFNICWDII